MNKLVRTTGVKSNKLPPVTIKKVGSSTRKQLSNDQLVIPLGNGWLVKGEHSKLITVITDNKRQAISIAISIAKTKSADVKIHDRTGKLVEARNFQNGVMVKKKL